ncbi:hypothetical protein A3F65_02010 [Candidatus Saccharibacteria bacterium RIFCSPHIGHO2_12_FULL_47_16b]|nr:MAG: hypothetical protein A3F65_02010 [Candidatus Saccharibacteria bacterium RIFCSPHIGHO2_12_FULL_47_16b]
MSTLDHHEGTPSTPIEAHAAEVAFVLYELTDGGDMTGAELLHIHRLAPPEVSMEELRDLAALISEAGWDARVSPVQEGGEEIGLGIEIQGGHHYEQSKPKF